MPSWYFIDFIGIWSDKVCVWEFFTYLYIVLIKQTTMQTESINKVLGELDTIKAMVNVMTKELEAGKTEIEGLWFAAMRHSIDEIESLNK